MKISKVTSTLFVELEDIIGNSCYNTKSTTRRGLFYEVGRYIRFPVWITGVHNGEKYEDKWSFKLFDTVPPDALASAKYKFGANHLLVGKVIEKLLTFLEERYNIDFDVLENEYQNKTKKDG